MAIPAGITTALVHLDAPLSFGGESGKIHASIVPSASLVWAATGTPLGAFVDSVSLDPGVALEVQLPHTDQPGFRDVSGAAVVNWHYRVEITYEKDDQIIPFPARDVQIPMGQSDIDIALIPAGTALPPTTAPTLVVTSIDGKTGQVTTSSLGLALKASPTFTGVVTTPRLIITSTTDASETSTDHGLQIGASTGTHMIIDNNEIGVRDPAVPNAFQPVSFPGGVWGLPSTPATGSTATPKSYVDGLISSHTHGAATASAAGFMPAADKAKLDAATHIATPSAVAMRHSSGSIQVVTGTSALDAANKQYVDTGLATKAATSHTHLSSQVTDFTEAVQDAVAVLLQQGTGITLAYDDAANTLTVTGTAGGAGTSTFDAEAARDALGVALVGVGVISIAVNDAADTITITSVATQNQTDAYLLNRQYHTGSQAQSTVTNLVTDLGGKLRPRGEFATGIAYALNDLVHVGALTFYCIQAHTSANPAPSATNQYWKMVGGAATAYAGQLFRVLQNDDGTWPARPTTYPSGALFDFCGWTVPPEGHMTRGDSYTSIPAPA